MIRTRLRLFPVFLLLLARCWAAPAVEYRISLAHRFEHLLDVRMHLPSGADVRTLQLPVWNALYQIRDFAQYVRQVSATGLGGQALSVRKLDKSTWRINGAENGADIAYQVFADTPGPFGAQLNGEHGFFNLAEILMYSPDTRASPALITFSDVPQTWAIATPLGPSGDATATTTFSARNYDHLVDSPVEIGNYSQIFFQQGGATYRIVVHADPADFAMPAIVRTVREIVTSEVAWMNDRPLADYLFILHLPRGQSGGGMEHANACAIEVSAEHFRDDPVGFAGLVAHEFFHLWNVKRIRPQSLEPIDYTRENYTTALWFSEGLTSTVELYMLLRTGMLDETRWLQVLSRDIGELERRPAHRAQSAEESSLDAWLEKYPEYKLPERSISYYNKGELIGVLLDLAVRDATQGRKSLRDVFQWMNRNYAQKKRFYPDSAGIRQAVEAVSGRDFKDFFEQYVSGTAELPYDRYLATVGLGVERVHTRAPFAGFVSTRNFDAPPVVVEVEQKSDAARLGLEPGDLILKINGKPVPSTIDDWISGMRIGETLKLRVSGRGGEREVKFKLAGRERDDYRLVNLPAISPEQRARRAAWLNGEDQLPSAAPGAIRAGVLP